MGFPLPVHHSAVMLTPLSLFFMSDPSSAPWTSLQKLLEAEKNKPRACLLQEALQQLQKLLLRFIFPQSVLQGRSEFCLEN